MSVIIYTKSLSAGYRKRKSVTTVLRNVDLELHEGELVSLLGANGAGKSTLIRTICGLQPALSGRVMVGDKDVERLTPRQLSKTIALVTTERTFAGGLTVSELVGLGRHPHTGFLGRLDEHDRQIVATAIEKVGISHKSESYVAELSDGERQKVMIAKALAQEAPVIILDEPTAFLDVASRVEVLQLLHDLARNERRTILISSHDIQQSMALSDRLWIVSDSGEIVSGVTEDLILADKISLLFSNRNVAFDPATGDFLTTRKGARQITLKADSAELNKWIANALRRNDLLACEADNPQIYAHTANDIRLNGNRLCSIEELLSALKDIN
ncbi:MAG: ABC transporter ATP-binding protein [Candidatus Limisoma sp.]|nr:ABC transporter ATP-binding protein [Candidatus Limisoma sp.]MDY6106437.1 ABC transporter ATP-binding protein [Candidatus Limisoma sp.]